MPVSSGTATDHVDLYDKLIDFLTLGETSGGPDWTLLRQDSSLSALLVAPGLSGLEQIHVGLSTHSHPTEDAFSLGAWMFRAYNDALADLEQPGMSLVRYQPLWDTNMPYWFIANGQRAIVIAKVSTVYTACHFGKFLPYGTPGEYPQPYYMGVCTQSSNTRFSSTSESVRNFWDIGNSGRLLTPAGQWVNVQNFQESNGEADTSNSNYTWPYQAEEIDADVKDRWRELRENVDGTHNLWPIVLHGANPQQEIYGELDGVYAIPAFGIGSEDTITIDSVEHLVVQNIHRTARYYYAAIRME